MTWARTRTRANNVSYVKQDSMGIGANAAARVEREHSSNNAAIEKAQAELRQEVFLREKRRKELEFLERGGNPLDFEYGDALPSQLSISIADLLLSDCDPKERKLFLLQNKHLNGVAELWKGLELYTPFRGPDIPGSVKGQSASDSHLTKTSRSADCCDQTKQVLRRGTLPSIVRVKEEKNVALSASVQDSKAETGPVVSGDSVTTEGTAEKSSETHSEQPTTAISSKEENHEKEQKASEKETSDTSGNTALPCELMDKAKDISSQQSDKVVPLCERPSRTEDEILEAAKAIQVGRICAAKKPVQDPARRKSHWDFVLEEMAWMANDFMQERLWKTTAAAHVCRSAAQATFWSRGKALAESKKKNLVKQESLELGNDKVLCEKTDTETQSRWPLENYAFRFLSNGVEPLALKAPCTPEVEERVSMSEDPFSEELHFVLPYGVSEAYKTSVEESWASKLAIYDQEMQTQGLIQNESEPEDEPVTPFHLKSIGVKQESDYFDQAVNRKKRKLLLKANADTHSELLDEESSDVLETYGTIPVKRQRTAAVTGRQMDKKSKKGKTNRARSMNKGTDSENEWLPEASEPEKPKRKKDQLLGHRMTKLSKLSNEHASERLKKTSLRKGDFLNVSINQPGNGVPWTTMEDQAIVVLEHDFGSNWELLCDILNAGSHIKGHFRSPKDCKERHLLLLEHLPLNRNSGDPQGLPGIPKGSAMMYLQRMQGPMEEDTLKFHFEQIVKAKQSCPQMQMEYQRERLQPHESHVDLVSQIYNTHHRFLSPLDFPDDRTAQPAIQKNDQARSKLGAAPAPPRNSATQDHNRSSGEFSEDAATVANGQGQPTSRNMQGAGRGNDSRATSGVSSMQKQQPVQSRPNLEDRKVPRQMNNGKQEAFHRIASWKEENAKIEQQHRMQQSQQISSEKRDLPHKAEAPVQQQQHAKLVMQPVPDSRPPSLQERGVPRQNFQQGMSRKSAQLPPCSTSQQHQEPAVQPVEQHQHPQLQPAFPRAPQPNSTGIGMQQQPNFHYNNHRCFSSSHARFAPPPVWRPPQNSSGIYNQMTCMNQVGPSSGDPAAFQQPRFQNPRSMKQAGIQRPPSQQTQCGMPYMGSPVPGAVRYQSFSGTQPYPSMYPGKPWQQQPQPRGGNVAVAADRPTLPASTSNLGSASSTTEAPDGSCK